MVKFVAKGKIKSGTLKDIAVITAPEEISKTKPDGFEASKGKIKVDVSGSGFKYVEAFGLKVPTTGTIEALDAYLKGDLVYKITGLSLTIAEAMTFTSVDEALQSIFSGDDLIKGSQKNDTLRGYDGNDTLKGRKGNDKLDGGEGDNILNGGKGKDQYIFKSGPETGVNTITKLQAGEKIKVDNAVFDDIGSKESSTLPCSTKDRPRQLRLSASSTIKIPASSTTIPTATAVPRRCSSRSSRPAPTSMPVISS